MSAVICTRCGALHVTDCKCGYLTNMSRNDNELSFSPERGWHCERCDSRDDEIERLTGENKRLTDGLRLIAGRYTTGGLSGSNIARMVLDEEGIDE